MANEKLIDIVGLEEFKDKLETVYQPLNTRLTNIANVSAISGGNLGVLEGFLKLNPNDNSVVLDGRTYFPMSGGTISNNGKVVVVKPSSPQHTESLNLMDGVLISSDNGETQGTIINGSQIIVGVYDSTNNNRTTYSRTSISKASGVTLTFGTQSGTIATLTDIENAVPQMKTLNTTATTAQTALSAEVLTGTGSITLHKVSKTGSYNDLLNKPTLGSAASKDTGTSSGNVPILDSNGKLNASVLPAIAITDTFVVSSQSAMLALDAQVGDVAVRTDLNKSFILKEEGANTLSHWQELLTPTDAVTSVNGKTGAVTLTAADVSAVRYDTASQGLSSTQQSNARTNIGAMSSSADLTTMGYSIATPAEIDALFA